MKASYLKLAPVSTNFRLRAAPSRCRDVLLGRRRDPFASALALRIERPRLSSVERATPS